MPSRGVLTGHTALSRWGWKPPPGLACSTSCPISPWRAWAVPTQHWTEGLINDAQVPGRREEGDRGRSSKEGYR